MLGAERDPFPSDDMPIQVNGLKADLAGSTFGAC